MNIVLENKSNFESAPAGSYLARCYRIIEVGTQKSEYLGQVEYRPKIMFAWELFGEKKDGSPLLMQDGRPFSIFKNYTKAWASKATLRKDLQSWRGKAFTEEESKSFSLNNVLGVYCMLNVIEKPGKDGKVYMNVDNISPVPPQIRRIGLPDPINKNEMFSLDNPDMEMFNGFSNGLKTKIQSSPEWQKLMGKASAQVAQVKHEPPMMETEDEDDQIPF